MQRQQAGGAVAQLGGQESYGQYAKADHLIPRPDRGARLRHCARGGRQGLARRAADALVPREAGSRCFCTECLSDDAHGAPADLGDHETLLEGRIGDGSRRLWPNPLLYHARRTVGQFTAPAAWSMPARRRCARSGVCLGPGCAALAPRAPTAPCPGRARPLPCALACVTLQRRPPGGRRAWVRPRLGFARRGRALHALACAALATAVAACRPPRPAGRGPCRAAS